MTNYFTFFFFFYFFFFKHFCVCVFLYVVTDGAYPWSLPIVADSWDRLAEVSVHPCNTKTRWKSI